MLTYAYTDFILLLEIGVYGRRLTVINKRFYSGRTASSRQSRGTRWYSVQLFYVTIVQTKRVDAILDKRDKHALKELRDLSIPKLIATTGPGPR